jgi:type IV secretory pathway VirB10-like protein
MTPADRRISELIDKWLTSIELHLQYVELSDAAYARAQPWPKHDRPTRWVLEVARQKTLELKQHCETRQAMGDSKFAEALELMAFLANLVGIQNIQRFIPLADPAKDGTGTVTTQTIEAPTVIKPIAAPRRTAANDDATREMPRIKPAAAKPAPAPPPSKPTPAKPTPKPAQATKTQAVKPAAKAEPSPKGVSADLKGKIITDAVRLMKWGKPWHELAELIARIADRPPAAEIRKVLRAHRAEIEAKAQVEKDKK